MCMMRNFTNAGGSILLHSTEIPELVHLCDRVLVLYDGRVAAALTRDQLTEASIMRPALGHEGASRRPLNDDDRSRGPQPQQAQFS